MGERIERLPPAKEVHVNHTGKGGLHGERTFTYH